MDLTLFITKSFPSSVNEETFDRLDMSRRYLSAKAEYLH